MCDKTCHTTSCPFAYTDESETVQNYGCLPTPMEIIVMRVLHGKTWACHSDHSKPCIGGLKAIKDYGYDNSIIDSKLITEHTITDKLVEYSENDLKKIQNDYFLILQEKHT